MHIGLKCDQTPEPYILSPSLSCLCLTTSLACLSQATIASVHNLSLNAALPPPPPGCHLLYLRMLRMFRLPLRLPQDAQDQAHSYPRRYRRPTYGSQLYVEHCHCVRQPLSGAALGDTESSDYGGALSGGAGEPVNQGHDELPEELASDGL